MKIVITGASGFVGQNLSGYLTGNGMEVFALSLRNEWTCPKDVEAIIHLAGKAHDITNTSSTQEYFKINTRLTEKLFDEFLQSDVRDFFYFSSVKAIADSPEHVLYEDATAMPHTPYGKSKLEAEKYLLSQKLPEGKRLFIVRPCMIHGPENKGNLNLLYEVVKKGVPWPLAAFHNQRSFLSIDNLSYLVENMIVNENMSSGVYNFADDESLSTNELVKLISKNLYKSPKLWEIPVGMIKTVAKIGDIFPLPLNSERLKKLTESYVVSNEKIKKALGIEKLPMTAKEGLEKTIRSFKEG